MKKTISIELAHRVKNLPPYLFAAIDRMKQEAIGKGVDLIDLSIGDLDIPTPKHIVQRMKKAVDNPAHHRYPSYEGMMSFRQSIADWYKRRFHVSLDPRTEVLSLIGSKEGIGHIPLAFINPGDVVLVPSPGYGCVYAGVLVDHTRAGVEHSLRWDVLSLRIRAGKQHAKLSLLVWSRHIRIIVASANLTEPGYRSNYEVAATVDLDPERADTDVLADAIAFLRRLVAQVPGAAGNPPEVQRAEVFLDRTERQARRWNRASGRVKIRQHLVCTLPAHGPGRPSRSTLDEAVQACRRRGASPNEVWVASPFFDAEDDTGRVSAALFCKLMARGGRREDCFCVPSARGDSGAIAACLFAPFSLAMAVSIADTAVAALLSASLRAVCATTRLACAVARCGTASYL